MIEAPVESIAFEEVTKVYGGSRSPRVAVDRLSLAVPRGEKLVVGAPLKLQVGKILAKAVVAKVDGDSAEAPLDNPKASFKGGVTGESSFEGVSKSLLGRL